jgi:hypothetical protein
VIITFFATTPRSCKNLIPPDYNLIQMTRRCNVEEVQRWVKTATLDLLGERNYRCLLNEGNLQVLSEVISASIAGLKWLKSRAIRSSLGNFP